MKYERLIRLQDELRIIRIWEERWGNVEDEDSRMARKMRREEILHELNESGWLSSMEDLGATASC